MVVSVVVGGPHVSPVGSESMRSRSDAGAIVREMSRCCAMSPGWCRWLVVPTWNNFERAKSLRKVGRLLARPLHLARLRQPPSFSLTPGYVRPRIKYWPPCEVFLGHDSNTIYLVVHPMTMDFATRQHTRHDQEDRVAGARRRAICSEG